MKSIKHKQLQQKNSITGGIQWFCPFADNYLELVDKSPEFSTASELKHFTWNEIVKFAEEDRWSLSYRTGKSGDWKAQKEGADGHFLVIVENMPYWADAIGQIPFSVDMMTDYLNQGFIKDRAIKETIKLGQKFGDGNLFGKSDYSNSYDNHMILRACIWTSKRYERKYIDSKDFGIIPVKKGVLVKTNHNPNELGKFLTKDEIDKYKHLW